jgi:hypothetical protein
MPEISPKLVIRRTEILPSFVTLLAATGVCLFIVLGKPISERVGLGVFNATYQFLLVAVLGSGVSMLFQAIAHARDARERGRTLQREIHVALVCGYNDAKRARRLLRARSRSTAAAADAIDAAEYETQLEALSSAQLSIELATRRVELNRSLFPQPDALVKALRAVGDYLNTIVDEWEDTRPRTSAAQEPLVIANLPRLDGFLRHWKHSPEFADGFKRPFDTVLALLERALANEA